MLAHVVFRADTLVSNSHCSISISVALFPVIFGSACAPLGLQSFCCLPPEMKEWNGARGAGRTVCSGHVIKPWPRSSDLCCPWGPWSLASWCTLVPEHSCSGILTVLGLVLFCTSRLQALQRRGHCVQKLRVMNLRFSPLGAKQRLGSLHACKEGQRDPRSSPGVTRGLGTYWPGKGAGRGA